MNWLTFNFFCSKFSTPSIYSNREMLDWNLLLSNDLFDLECVFFSFFIHSTLMIIERKFSIMIMMERKDSRTANRRSPTIVNYRLEIDYKFSSEKKKLNSWRYINSEQEFKEERLLKRNLPFKPLSFIFFVFKRNEKWKIVEAYEKKKKQSKGNNYFQIAEEFIRIHYFREEKE